MSEYVLELKGITKIFPGVKALNNVQFQLKPGEVHALMGENGAGKSTFIKVITGVHKAEEGEMYLFGQKVDFKGPKDAQEAGIAAVYQHPTSYPHLTVAENIFMGHEIKKNHMIQWKAMNEEANKLLKQLNADFDSTAEMGTLSVAQQQMVEIAKALSTNARIIIMDEPTAALTKNESEELYRITEKLRDDGKSVIFISHRLEDMYRLASRVTVFRDAQYIGTYNVAEIQPPELINNVRTQVRDLDFDTPPTLSPAATISRAWQMMQADRISVLPVANEDGTLYGMLSAGDVASYDMLAVRNSTVKNVPVYNLLSVLEGKVLNEGGQIRDEISGEVTIALPAGRENLLFSSPDSIVVCGDQPDMIKRALELRVTCVIVCQAEVSRELLELDTDTCIISTPYDAYRAVHLICHSLPIERICKSHDLVSFHLDDYIDDVRNTVLESRFRAYPILDENEHVVGTLSRFHLLRPRRKQVILVDHNEKAQSVPGLDQADILEIVDHHRLADIETNNPIYVRNEPVGSSTTIVADMYQEKGLMPSAKMAGLMAAAIVSDTVMFKSPTCTQRDIDIANRMSRIANVSLEELGQTIFSAATGEDKSAESIIRTDYKEFHIGGHNLAVSQITCLDSDRLMARKEEFLATMETIRKKNGLDIVLLMITNVLVEGSYLLYSGDTETIRQAFNITGEEKNSVFLPKIMSRKKQIIPSLSALWG